MYNEVTFTAVALVFVWIVLLLLDLLVSGVTALVSGLRFGRVFCWGLLSLILPVLLMAYGVLIERNWFKVNKIELAFDNLPEQFDGYRLVQLSDIHSMSFRNRAGQLDRAVGMVGELAPDLVVFTGDLITVSPDELDVTAPVMARLSAPDGVISVLGNHDYSTHRNAGKTDTEALDDLIQRERALGWKLLLNEKVILRRGGDSLAVVGVENISSSKFFPSTGNLAVASGGTDGLFRILLSHDPQHWDMEVSGMDFPLTLSGHTHAAQVSLLGWSPARLMFRRVRGLFSENGRYLYINQGLGETAFPARIGVRPEITLITLLRKKADG